MSQMTSDRIATSLQETGQSWAVASLAEVLTACDALGLDPHDVVVHGRLTVAEPALSDKQRA